ncbi:DUF2262 domain-containing protein [Aeoliella sp. ICT_H6.2]|uniref:DUF2262 domain-containing protein n=1 Tax=Aeoliella straminimaris TaxID=2954799 RepID=A0A9X2FCS5_9BACT|nr:DUF2262 domain-containing protein [Aeoliella straminimaris]MCO6046682.1 DUF2262 domain-containing protein [Aeoliella straminimaris]
MPTPYHPPGIESLSEIDMADVTYQDQSVIICGLVSLEPQAGSNGTNDSYMVHSLSFAAWHRPGEPIVERELDVFRAVPKGEEFFDTDCFEDFPELSIQKFRVLLSEDETRAVFEQAFLMDDKDDEALIAVREELKKPVVVSTKLFGDLVLNRQVEWFEGTAIWNGEKVPIAFDTDEELGITKQLQTAEELFQDSAKWGELIAEFAAKENLSVANDWRLQGAPRITKSEFLQRIKPSFIIIQTDGEFKFSCDDDDMFGGHSIDISGSLQEGLTHSRISG